RLHAAAERTEISRGFRLQRRYSGKRAGQILEERREEAERQGGEFYRKAQSDGGGCGGNRRAERHAGSETGEDLRESAKAAKYFLGGGEDRAGAKARKAERNK